VLIKEGKQDRAETAKDEELKRETPEVENWRA
jgi:hypothetical protein